MHSNDGLGLVIPNNIRQIVLLKQKSPNYVYGMIDFGNLRQSLQKTGGLFLNYQVL